MNAHSFRTLPGRALVIALALALGSSCSDESPVAPSPPAPADAIGFQAQGAIQAPTNALPTERTPFQESVRAKIMERKAEGLPVPVITYDYHASPGSSKTLAPGEQATFVATTTLVFDSPEQAGHARWPDFVVEDHMPPEAKGFVHAGDYTGEIRDRLAQEIPGVWSRYEFGYEPRTYTFTEEYTLTGSEQTRKTGAGDPTLDQILMGFTYTGPDLDYTIGFSISIFGFEIAGFHAGFALDWGLGVRLPMELGLTAAGPLLEGTAYSPTSDARGLDWTAADYANVGVDPESGNEFVLSFVFFLGIKLVVFDTAIVDYAIDIDQDASSSFETPFGPGAVFDLPSLDIEIFTIDIAVAEGGVGFSLTPQAGSNKYTASWTASGDATGNGMLTYSDPAQPVPLSSVLALDGPGTADIRLDDLEYWFTRFVLELGLYFRIDVLGILGGRYDIPLADFDLSGVFGDLGVGVHESTANAMTVSVPIANVPPTAVIDRTAATMIQGVPTFLVHVDQPLPFTGTASDPGRDDLTLSWDWDDGAPSPDVSTRYPVPGTVTEVQSHACPNFRLYSVGFRAVDDDGASAEDRVAVISCGAAGTLPLTLGTWLSRTAPGPAPDADLDGCLAIAGHMSGVFGELRDASTPEAAGRVLRIDPENGNQLERLDRELLLTWLNFAIGAWGWNDLVDTDGDRNPDTPFAVVMNGAEALRGDPSATKRQLFAQITMLRRLNEPNRTVVGI